MKPGIFAYVNGDSVDGCRTVHEAFVPDMAELTDKPHEIMAENFGIPLAAAARIQAWHDAEMAGAWQERFVHDFAKIMSVLLQPNGDMAAKVWGLAFSFGLASRMNGVQSMAAVARRLFPKGHPKEARSRALLSHYKRFWDNALPSTVRIFGKSPEACAKYSAARIAFVETGLTRAERETDQAGSLRDPSGRDA
ncbi:MAG: hypothetical protein H0X34_20420 [Chthoniobacterales bacterium]|nr:hypothetical protein [Chthoniobacterales bacterium]